MLLDSGEDKNHVTTGGRGSAMAGSGGQDRSGRENGSSPNLFGDCL